MLSRDIRVNRTSRRPRTLAPRERKAGSLRREARAVWGQEVVVSVGGGTTVSVSFLGTGPIACFTNTLLIK